ncbi:MAG: TIM barrel protein [Chloroflexota bacterium]
MKLSLCIDAIFFHTQASISTRLNMLGTANMRAFEFWDWWTKDLAQMQQAMAEHRLTCVACCTRFISLVDAAKREAYLQGLAESIKVAQQLGCKTLISQVGDDLGIARADQRQSLIEGLKASVPLLENAGIKLVIEPLNTLVDHAGYYLTSSDEAFAIIDAVGSPHIKVLFDIYHQQISEGHVIQRIVDNIDKIGHFHAAGNPGRNELYRGELNYHEIFRAIKAAGYEGYVGLEYFPLEEPLAGIRPFLSQVD